MKKLGLVNFILLVMAVVSLSSCGGDDRHDDEPEIYYVRYSIGVEPGCDAMISYSDVDGNNTIRQICHSGSIEVTVGPVMRGFDADVTGNQIIDDEYKFPQWMRIDVSRNGKPFVMKKYRSEAVSLNYTVGD